MGSPVAILGNISSRNFIINGGMDFAQRTNGSLVNLTTSSIYYMDRWASSYAGSWGVTPTIQQVQIGTQIPNGIANECVGCFGNPGSTSASFSHIQKIEAIHSRELNLKFASIGYWVFPATTTCQSSINLSYPTVVDNWGSVVTFFNSSFTGNLTPNIWNYVQFNNIPIPALATNGLELTINISNFGFSGSPGTGAYISEVIVNQGAVANQFRRATGNILSELQLCQRYAWNPFYLNAGVAPGGGQTILLATAQSTAGVAIGNFPVTMRVPPSITQGTAGDFYFTPFTGSSTFLNSFAGDQRATNIGYFNSFALNNVGSTVLPGMISIRNSDGLWLYEADL